MKAFLVSLLALVAALPAAATVSIEFQLGGVFVPEGSIGVIVVDAGRNGFTDPAEAAGSVLTPGEAFGLDDVVVAVLEESPLSEWGSRRGFAELLAPLDYASWGLDAGDPMILHVFPVREKGDVVRSGEPHLSYRSDQIGEFTPNSTMGFALPSEGGAHLLAAIEPGLGGGADLASMDLSVFPYESGSGRIDRTLSSTAQHNYYFELNSTGFLTIEGLGGPRLLVELTGPGGQVIFAGGGQSFSFHESMPAGLYQLEISDAEGGTYQIDFRDSDVRIVIPDVAVGSNLGALNGKNILDAAPGQLVSLMSSKARPVAGFAAIANLGELPDKLAVRGGPGNALCRISFLDATGNVTAALLSGNYRTVEVAQGNAAALTVQFVPNKRKLTKKAGNRTRILKKTFTTFVRADSTRGAVATDSAMLQARTK